ncbi:HEAT repeat domain-containing protein [Geitlerinema sp. PCC 9228]|jgi:phycocyanobilin lyase beta subunit|uniref:HEAT repeat domain-containing protein n=1 Tax=Geitlerinema sp. PCC 9228 TaxID=111611 RepID=UPI0008F9C44B|nr:HEAT repeat domain-containing protein [Geitlerinema sp. PCC 9228]
MTIQELIQAVEEATTPDSLVQAVRSLAATRDPKSIPTLIDVLGYNNPGAAIAAVEGLTNIGTAAVQPILEKIDGYNYGARAYSIRALAAIADPAAFEVLLQAAATDFSPSVRRAAAKGMGRLHWEKMPPTGVSAAQSQAVGTLLELTQAEDWSIRYAAVVGLEGLARALGEELTSEQEAIRHRLQALYQQDAEVAVRARAHQALQVAPACLGT